MGLRQKWNFLCQLLQNPFPEGIRYRPKIVGALQLIRGRGANSRKIKKTVFA